MGNAGAEVASQRKPTKAPAGNLLPPAHPPDGSLRCSPPAGACPGVCRVKCHAAFMLIWVVSNHWFAGAHCVTYISHTFAQHIIHSLMAASARERGERAKARSNTAQKHRRWVHILCDHALNAENQRGKNTKKTFITTTVTRLRSPRPWVVRREHGVIAHCVVGVIDGMRVAGGAVICFLRGDALIILIGRALLGLTKNALDVTRLVLAVFVDAKTLLLFWGENPHLPTALHLLSTSRLLTLAKRPIEKSYQWR